MRKSSCITLVLLGMGVIIGLGRGALATLHAQPEADKKLSRFAGVTLSTTASDLEKIYGPTSKKDSTYTYARGKENRLEWRDRYFWDLGNGSKVVSELNKATGRVEKVSIVCPYERESIASAIQFMEESQMRADTRVMGILRLGYNKFNKHNLRPIELGDRLWVYSAEGIGAHLDAARFKGDLAFELVIEWEGGEE